MSKIGFDNQKYLMTQSEQIRKRIALLAVSFTLSLVENCLTITMLHVFFPDLHLIAKLKCFSNSRMMLKL